MAAAPLLRQRGEGHISGIAFLASRRPAMGTFLTIFAVTIVVVVVAMALTLRIATQYQRAVIFRLGRYNRTAGPGLYFLWPFIEGQTTQDLRTRPTIVEKQETIARDNVPIKINAVIWQRVVDPMHAVLEVADVSNAVMQVAVTTLSRVIGQQT